MITRKDWNKEIDIKSHEFKGYLKKIVGDRYFSLLEAFSKEVDVFIFSGIIIDFLLEIGNLPRDLDFTFRGKLSNRWFCIVKNYFDVHINKFGGYKLNAPELIPCDVWCIDNTYGIRNDSPRKKPNDLLKSVFLNLTSVVYDYSCERFIYDNSLLKFLSTRKMEIVNTDNPDIELCFLNLYHNYKKYGCEIGDSVGEWAKLFFYDDLSFDDVQLRHYKKIVYSRIEILNFISDKLLK